MFDKKVVEDIYKEINNSDTHIEDNFQFTKQQFQKFFKDLDDETLDTILTVIDSVDKLKEIISSKDCANPLHQQVQYTNEVLEFLTSYRQSQQISKETTNNFVMPSWFQTSLNASFCNHDLIQKVDEKAKYIEQNKELLGIENVFNWNNKKFITFLNMCIRQFRYINPEQIIITGARIFDAQYARIANDVRNKFHNKKIKTVKP
ncbi:hypothetical protein TVAG_484500 [Trichomonas vaginalis G3]|uniref:Uncharacterized protein n=1 Tax=Trichomonas vaginalis (strain ATCC PRA-98 / G3) TaxID=412133 RepID=A2F1X8_TRIV3|nr:hypothetical protein TVAGG3_0128670 [Trichomonas vaginalis G3]EAY01076.1 hypothetical protein TVAG_484500 [Trichomonas vaginalis G3]KAI5545941.1 hypothetical protein TVAGG3_0128670 [Trichomonas vaginalis G3]|eukprot:XP_001313944.1 hypothetical protein [Trichomonas vaginalis G3]